MLNDDEQQNNQKHHQQQQAPEQWVERNQEIQAENEC